MNNKQFTSKQLSAALSGAVILLLVSLLNVKNLNGTLYWAVFFAALSLPALIAIPILDDIMNEECKKTEFNRFSIACFIGPGAFFLCVTAVFFNYSIIAGITFFISGILWLYLVTKQKKSEV